MLIIYTAPSGIEQAKISCNSLRLVLCTYLNILYVLNCAF